VTVLLVEDEEAIATPLASGLERHGYTVEWVQSSHEADAVLLEQPPDLLILDVYLLDGEEAGFELLKRVREAGFTMSVIMLTARDALADRVQGLEMGADDYLAKPFAFAELLARVRALQRRVNQIKENQLERGPLTVDFATREVRWQGEGVPLTGKEYGLLELLARNPERIFSVETILERVWSEEADNPNLIRVYVYHLRKKLGEEIVEKVSGGYRLGV
jgi:two-component system, OmpR family, response regulator QseB